MSNSLTVNWDRPATGTATHYRLQINRDGQSLIDITNDVAYFTPPDFGQELVAEFNFVYIPLSEYLEPGLYSITVTPSNPALDQAGPGASTTAFVLDGPIILN